MMRQERMDFRKYIIEIPGFSKYNRFESVFADFGADALERQ